MKTPTQAFLADPNGELAPDELEWALRTGAGAFYRCRIKPNRLTGWPYAALVLGQMGSVKYLVYTRLTKSESEEEGAGPVPLAVVDIARELGAQPRVVRVNMSRIGKGIGFKYWGVNELEQELKSNIPEWQSILLRGKTVEDFLKMKNGKLNQLELTLSIHQNLNDGIASELLGVQMKIDGIQVGPTLDLHALACSTFQNDEHFIFTCDCGEPGCNGIWNGVVVVHQNGMVLWKAYGVAPRRVLVFDRAQYRDGILSLLKAILPKLKSESVALNLSAYLREPKSLEEALYHADEPNPPPRLSEIISEHYQDVTKGFVL